MGLNYIFTIGCYLVLLCNYGIATVYAGEWAYKVRKGDNLWNLTEDYLLDLSYLQRVQKLNGIADPKRLIPGTVLRIPKPWIRHFPALIRVQTLHGQVRIREADSSHSRTIGKALFAFTVGFSYSTCK